jgi:hypothetical protein
MPLLHPQPLSIVIGLLEVGNGGVGGLDSASFEDDWLARRSGHGYHGGPAGVGAEAQVPPLHSYQISTS